MLSTLALALAIQVAPQKQSKADSIRAEQQRRIADDIAFKAADRARRSSHDDGHSYRPVTAKDSATAFKDPGAREILMLARSH